MLKMSALALGLAMSASMNGSLSRDISGSREWSYPGRVESAKGGNKLPKGHSAKRKAKRKQQRAARRK